MTIDQLSEELMKDWSFYVRSALRYLRRYEDAEDAVQQAFFLALRASKSEAAFKGDCTLRTWFCLVLRNSIFQEKRRKQTLLLEDCSDEVRYRALSCSEDPEFELQPDRDKVWGKFMSCFDQRVKDIDIFYHDGMTIPEFATFSGTPIGTVKTRLYRARKKFAKENSSLILSYRSCHTYGTQFNKRKSLHNATND